MSTTAPARTTAAAARASTPHRWSSLIDAPALLAAGLAAGPVFLGSTLTQAATRDGFDMRRHAASLLSNGEWGWIQTITFAVTGVLVSSAAVGTGRVLRDAGWGPWSGRLLLVFGVSFLGAAVFPADPTLGFPLGTAAGAGPITPIGAMHMFSGMTGFMAVIAASVVVGRHQLRGGDRRRGLLSLANATVFLLAIAGIMSGSGSASAGVTLGFWTALGCSFLWLAVTCRWARPLARTSDLPAS